MSFAIAAVDRKKYIAKRESREARRNPADVAAVAAAALVGKFNPDHTYFIYYKCVDIIKTFVMLILYNVTYFILVI